MSMLLSRGRGHWWFAVLLGLALTGCGTRMTKAPVEDRGTAAAVPVQFSATSHSEAAPRHSWVEGAKVSLGHARLVPSHCSTTSQAPAEGRQVVAAAATPQVPFTAAPAVVLQAWQSVVTPPPQAVLQHTPSAQKPLAHSSCVVQVVPSTLVPWHWF